MKTKKERDSDFKDIAMILSAWDRRLDQPTEKADSFYSESYESLLSKSILFHKYKHIPLIKGIPLNYDCLNPKDVAISFFAGGIGAVIPKLSADFFDKAHDHLSHANQLLGKIFNHDGEWIDTKIFPNGTRHPMGAFHRFRPDGKHDLLNFSGLITSWKQFGIFEGTLKFILHIGLDSCSQSGVPIPGTTNFLYWIRENFGMKLYSLKEQSEYAGIRMADILQAGATQGIISLYTHFENIPRDSLRIPQLGIVSQGGSAVGSAYIAYNTNNDKLLSKISYPACMLFAKNCLKFYKDLNNISKEILKMDNIINDIITNKL